MRTRRRVPRVGVGIVAVALLAVALPARAAAPSLPAGFQYVGHEVLAPGVDHYLVRRPEPAQEIHVARIDGSLVNRIRVVTAWDHVGGVPRERTSAMCLRVRCIVGINGDFTDVDFGGPVGSTVSGGELFRTPRMRHGNFSISDTGALRIGHDLDWQGLLQIPGLDQLALWGVNVVRPSEGPVLYTTRWGSSTRTADGGVEIIGELVGEPSPAGTLVRLGDIRRTGNTKIAPGTVVISARDAGATALQRFSDKARQAGGEILLQVDTGGAVEALGGSPVIVKDRNWAFPNNSDSFTQNRHPRTVVGWTAAGELLLVTVDGRQPGYASGMSLHETANLLIGLGAVEALNLDGGGSATFVVNSKVRNRPSDTGRIERGVTSALMLLPPPGTVATAAARNIGSSCPPGGVPEDGFTDIVPGSGHESAIDCAVWWGVSSGTSGSTYAPSRTLTRAQLASFLARLVNRSGGSLPESPPDLFDDDSQSPHRRAIDKVAAVGIMSGRGDGTFGPDLPVTRAQLATALAEAVEYRTGGALNPSADYFADDEGLAHEPSINRVAYGGLVSGVQTNLYGPTGRVRRDQVATFLVRALDLLVEEAGAAPPS